VILPLLFALQALSPSDVGYSVQVPDFLKEDSGTAANIITLFGEGRPGDHGGNAYLDPERRLGIFVLWRVTTGPAQPAAVRASLEELRARGGAYEEQLGEREATARLDLSKGGVRTLARTVVFLDSDGKLREVVAECSISEDDLGTMREPCERSLASLTVTWPADKRLALRDVPPPAVKADTAPAVAPVSGAPASGPLLVVGSPPAPKNPAIPWIVAGLGAALLVGGGYMYKRSLKK
jgi:hypothetical protein